jgi:DNA polymerase III delta subunit
MSDKKINVAWVSGGYHRAKELFDKIKEKFKDASPVHITEDSDPMELLNEIESNHCFSTKRIVMVFGIPDMTETQKKKLKASLETIADDVFVVFFMINPTKEKALFSIVEKVGKIYDFDTSVPVREASGWIVRRATELGVAIEQNAAIALAENSGIDSGGKGIPIDVLEMALRRLILYAPTKKSYDTFDVVATAVFYENFVIWDLLNACDEKDYEKCLNMLSKASSLSDNAIEGIAQMMSTLLWKFRLLLFLKEKKASKVDRQTILAQALAMRKISYDGMGFFARTKVNLVETGPNAGKPATLWSTMPLTSAMDGFNGRTPAVDLYNRKDLYLIVKALEDASILIRSSTSENEAFLIADTVLMTVCGSMDSKIINRMQKSIMKTRV